MACSPVRENGDAARARSSVDATRVKLVAMTISAAMAAAAVRFYARYFLFIDASIAYGPWISVEALLGADHQRDWHLFGPLLGALMIKTLGEAAKLVTGDFPGARDLITSFAGAVHEVLVVGVAPRSLAGIGARAAGRGWAAAKAGGGGLPHELRTAVGG